MQRLRIVGQGGAGGEAVEQEGGVPAGAVAAQANKTHEQGMTDHVLC